MSKSWTKICARRILLTLFCFVGAVSLETTPARATGHWSAPLPNSQTLNCGPGEGISCAEQSLFTWFPDTQAVSCFYMYDIWGHMSLAVCAGHDPGGNHRQSNASFSCDSGDVTTGTDDCTTPLDKTAAKDPPPSKQSPGLKPQCDCQTTADPVTVSSGNTNLVVTDFATTDGRLVFKRTYNSNVSYWAGPAVQSNRLGRAWRSNFDVSLISIPYQDNFMPPWSANLVVADGSERVFGYVSNGNFQAVGFNPLNRQWVNDNKVQERLTIVGSNFNLTDVDDTVYIFDSTGRLNSIKYRDGYTQTLTWNASGQNTQITDSLGRSLTFVYGSAGLLQTLIKPDGTQINYHYQDKSDTQAYLPLGYGSNGGGASGGLPPQDNIIIPSINIVLVSVSYPDTTQVQYLYENTSFPYALTGVVDERGVRYASWTYDATGRAATSALAGNAQTYSLTYDTTNFTTSVTNPSGQVSVYSYNRNVPGNALITGIQALAALHTPAATVSYGYDGNGFTNQITDGEGRVTSITNEGRGLPVSITRGYGTPSASTTAITWHASLHVPTQIVEPELTTSFTWNTSNQLSQVTQTDTTSQTVPYSTSGQARTWAFTYNTAGLLASVDGPLSGSGDTVSYTYNTNGYIASVTDEVGRVTQFTAWNGFGQPTTMVDANGVTTNLGYDPRGRLTGITVDPAGVNAVTTLAYDAAGDITKITRPNGAYLQYTWDDARRLTTVIDNTGASVQYTRDAMGNATGHKVMDSGSNVLLSQTATFDEVGRLLTFVGSAGQTWTYAYDRVDNQVSVTDPRSNVYHSAFDSLNRLIGETDEANGVITLTRNGNDDVTAYTDPRSLTTTYVRDGFGEVIQRTSPDTGTTVYQYSAAGKVTQVTDGRGVVTTLAYDNAGRLLSKQYPASIGENITYTWDSIADGNHGIGRLTEIDDASGSVQWSYDALGRIVQETKTTASTIYTIGYAYDAAGNIIQITYPSGRTVSYARDSLGRISGVTTQAAGASSAVTLASGVTYEPSGPLASLTYGNGLALTKSYTQDYLTSEIVVTGTAGAITDRTYSWIDSINLTGITETAVAGRNETYAYTVTNRLQSGTGPWGSEVFGYDLVGNRTSETLGSTISNYNYPAGSNQLSSVTQGSTTVRSLTYDGAGNVTADSRSGTSYSYGYNNRGRLAELAVAGNVTADYTYDGLERMAIRATQNMTPAGTTHYLYDLAGHLLAEASSSGTPVTEYIWLDNLPLALFANLDTASPNLWYVNADHLNRPTKMTDGNQAVVWDAVYWPFGAVYSVTGTSTNNLRFPGQYFLLESGLHYNWYRHYDPSLGRYTQPDPLGFVDGPSVFAYAESAPVIKVDPVGLQDSTPRQRIGQAPPFPGTPEWWYHFRRGTQGLVNACANLLHLALNDGRGDVVYSEPGPKDAPPGTRPIDKWGIPTDDVHDIKKNIGGLTGTDWVGVTPDGDVIIVGPDGEAVNVGHVDDYTKRPLRQFPRPH